MLTQRQREVYEFIVSYVDSHGYPPTVREIGEAVGLASPSTVHAHLANLERAGYLRRDPTKPRALELVKRERATAGATVALPDVGEVRVLPLVGEIAAGGPLLADENIEDHLAVPDPLSRGGERTSAGRCSARIGPPPHSRAAPAITCRSSRTFPGQV